MKDFEKGLLILIIGFVLGACAPLGLPAPNFQDGTWSSCTYSKPDGTTFTGPLQLGGAPLASTKPDGTKVECVLIPARNPVPAVKAPEPTLPPL